MGIIKEIKQELDRKPTERFIGSWLMVALMNTIVLPETAEAFANWLRRLVGFCKEEYDNFVNSTNKKFADIFEIIDEKFSALIEKVINLQSNQAEKIETLSTKINIVQQQLQDKIQCLETQLQERPTATEITSITTNPNYDYEQVIRKMVEIIAVSWGVHYQEMDISNILSWDRIALEQIIDNIDNYFRVRYINRTAKDIVLNKINGMPKVQKLFENFESLTKQIRDNSPDTNPQKIIEITVEELMKRYNQLASKQNPLEKPGELPPGIDDSTSPDLTSESPILPAIQEVMAEILDDGIPKSKGKKTKK